MSKQQLTERRVQRLTKPGTYADRQNNLYLRVAKTGGKSWTFRFMRDGRRHDVGIGPASIVTLDEARQKAAELRRILYYGGDPLAHVRASRRMAGGVPTFAAAADACIGSIEAGWRNDKHRRQWRCTIAEYALPILGCLPVDRITTDDVLSVLKPIWQTRPETASRLRQRIERVLDFATARGWRTGPNPARWRGHLANILPRAGKVRHHAAVPWQQMPELWNQLERLDTAAALALRFTILTAARSGEVRGATWSEIDLDEKVWTVPADRIKAGREHRVPLSPAATAILEAVRPTDADGLIFAGARRGRPLSDVSLVNVLRRLGYAEATVHGMRSAFRDWAAEATSFPGEVAEAALAHVVGNKVEAAYRRGDLFAKRRDMMDAWARFLESADGCKVIPLRR